MKKKNTFFLPAICILLAFSLSNLITSPVSYAKGPKKVAILPFAMNADRDLTFLQEGIVDMLGSRLAWKGEVQIIEKEIVRKKAAEIKGPLNKEKAIAIGKALHADYVILGSLTVFGESVSIDSKILDVAQSQELVTAFNQSKGMDEVIPTITQFAQDINDKIMGRTIRPPVSASKQEAGRSAEGLIRLSDKLAAERPGHVQDFRIAIVSLALGDVDGDGKTEVVFIDERSLYIYRWEADKLVELGKFGGSYRNRYLSVDVGDTDRDGKAEIYVNNTFGEGVDSFAVTWQNGGLTTLAKGQNWFFRVLKVPGKGDTLIGQKRQISAGFIPGIYILEHRGRGFAKGEKLPVPHQTNALSFALGDITGRGKNEVILFRYDEKLEMFGADGGTIWLSDTAYGGSPFFIEDTSGPAIVSKSSIFLPPRLLLVDTDGDGHNEVVVCRNEESAGRLLSRMRFFSSGRVEFLKWQGTGMATIMKTAQLSRYISDYAVADVDNDGQQELILAVVKDYSGLKGKGNRSQIVIYELQ